MAADLTNPSGIEMRMKFAVGDIFRYINNNYQPNTAATDWSLDGVVETYAEQWNNSDLAAVLNNNTTLVEITGRVRGRVDAGVTYVVPMDIQGTIAGQASPDWLTHCILQIPANSTRHVITGSPSIFQKGRIAMPPPSPGFLVGNRVSSAALTLYSALFPYFMQIDASTIPTPSPAFSLTMSRVVGGVLQARGNVLSLQNGDIGTQLTARH